MDLRSGYPFSLVKNGLVYNYPKLEKDIKTDVVIMGGGISGALTAYYLLKQNINCVVMDARTIGLGSTCASTSLLQYEIDTPLHTLKKKIGNKPAEQAYWYCKESIDKLEKIAAKLKFGEFEKKDSLYFAAAKKDINFLKEEFTARQKAGFDVQFLEGDEVQRKTDVMAPAAILSTSGAQTNAYLFTHYLHQYGIARGLEVYDRSPVTLIDHKKRGVVLVTGNGHTIHARKMVYATGYEVVEYIDKPIVKLQSTYAVVSEPFSDRHSFWKKERLLWNTADPYLYMRTTTDNRILIGGRDEDFYSPKKRDALLKKKSKQLVGDFAKQFPDISFIPEFSWTGTFGSTKDGLPYIGAYQPRPNSYFALGFGGNGITFSLLAAEIITAHIKGEHKSAWKIFSFNR